MFRSFTVFSLSQLLFSFSFWDGYPYVPKKQTQNFNVRHAWAFFSRLSLSLRGRRKVVKFITTFTTVHRSVLRRSNCIIQIRTKFSWQHLHPTSSFSQFLLLFGYEDWHFVENFLLSMPAEFHIKPILLDFVPMAYSIQCSKHYIPLYLRKCKMWYFEKSRLLIL